MSGVLTHRQLVIAGLVTGLLSLLAHLPAAWLHAALQSRLPALQLYGLSGTWGSGAAAGIGLQNRLVLQDLRWSLRPLALLMGRLAVHVDGGGQIATLDGELSSSPWRQRIDALRMVGSVKNLATAAGLPYVPIDGQVGLDLQTLVWAQGQPQQTEGTLDLRGLSWTLARDPLLLGDFHAALHTEAGIITATVSAPSGPLEASGSAKLMPDRRYEIDLLLKPRPGASEMLQNTVRAFGTPDAQGNYHIRQQGQWNGM